MLFPVDNEQCTIPKMRSHCGVKSASCLASRWIDWSDPITSLIRIPVPYSIYLCSVALYGVGISNEAKIFGLLNMWPGWKWISVICCLREVNIFHSLKFQLKGKNGSCLREIAWKVAIREKGWGTREESRVQDGVGLSITAHVENDNIMRVTQSRNGAISWKAEAKICSPTLQKSIFHLSLKKKKTTHVLWFMAEEENLRFSLTTWSTPSSLTYCLQLCFLWKMCVCQHCP